MTLSGHFWQKKLSVFALVDMLAHACARARGGGDGGGGGGGGVVEQVTIGASLTSVNKHKQNALQLAEMGKWTGADISITYKQAP